MTESSVEVFHSASDREAGEAERILTAAGIDYTMRLEPKKHADGVCYLGLLFEVAPEHAQRAKELLADLNAGSSSPAEL